MNTEIETISAVAYLTATVRAREEARRDPGRWQRAPVNHTHHAHNEGGPTLQLINTQNPRCESPSRGLHHLFVSLHGRRQFFFYP